MENILIAALAQAYLVQQSERVRLDTFARTARAVNAFVKDFGDKSSSIDIATVRLWVAGKVNWRLDSTRCANVNEVLGMFSWGIRAGLLRVAETPMCRVMARDLIPEDRLVVGKPKSKVAARA